MQDSPQRIIFMFLFRVLGCYMESLNGLRLCNGQWLNMQTILASHNLNWFLTLYIVLGWHYLRLLLGPRVIRFMQIKLETRSMIVCQQQVRMQCGFCSLQCVTLSQLWGFKFFQWDTSLGVLL